MPTTPTWYVPLATSEAPSATYQVVVVGSGYGGSITAARLAQKGLEVALLERGREWAPPSFPTTALEAIRQVRGEGNPLGLFDYRKGDDLDVLSGCALGGTSLINCNVAHRAPAEVLAQPRWPAELRARAALDPFYAVAERVLGARPVPNAMALPKVAAQAGCAERRGLPLVIPDVTVNFDLDGVNEHGAATRPCTLCGDCVTGCRVGAKNTLPQNYLRLARRAGCRIVTHTEVSFVLPRVGGGWELHAMAHPAGGGPATPHVIFASAVVLAAGSLGSTGILLRSRARGLPVGPRLGHHFGGNGDRAGYGYNGEVFVGAIGVGEDTASGPVGPTIASIIERLDARGRLFLIEDGACPSPLVLPTRLLPVAAALRGEDTDGGLLDEAGEAARILRDQLGIGKKGALAHTMLYLAMGDDDADGRVILDHRDAPRVVWGSLADKPLFAEMDAEMRALVAELGGTWVPNPNPWRAFGGPPMSVHPLGGCPMGSDVDAGVVDHLGRVLAPDGGVHPGLFVADGAVVPSALRVNPFLTIAAIAERVAHHIDPADVPARPTPGVARAVAPPPVGLSFTETMSGFATTEVTTASTPAQFLEAERRGRAAVRATPAQASSFELSFRLTVIVDDLDAFITSAEHEAGGEGFVDGPFGHKPTIERARFNLFVAGADQATRRMLYVLLFTAEDGRRLRIEGEKLVHDDPGYDSFSDVTTLFTTVREGWGEGGPVFAQGVLRIQGAALLAQFASFRVHHAPSPEAGVAALGRFGAFFFGSMWEVFARAKLGG